MNSEQIVRALNDEIDRLTKARDLILGEEQAGVPLRSLPATSARLTPTGRRPMTQAERERRSRAQKARWDARREAEAKKPRKTARKKPGRKAATASTEPHS